MFIRIWSMNKALCKKTIMTVLFFSFMIVLPRVLSASDSVTVIRSESKGEVAVSVDLDTMKQFTIDMQTVDPNFKARGSVTYSGITLEKLLEFAQAPLDQGVTFLGWDQYVGYISLDRGVGKRAILAFAMDGQPISLLEGGPLKVIYPGSEKIHANGYTWYVETILIGRVENASLIVESDNSKGEFFWKELVSMAKNFDRAKVSIPLGFRHLFPGPDFYDKKIPVAGVLLQDLLRHVGVVPKNTLTITPLAGPDLVLDHALLNYPVTLVCAMNGQSLHPVLGGPFSLQFPIEDHPEIRNCVPESGAFFFIKQIRVD